VAAGLLVITLIVASMAISSAGSSVKVHFWISNQSLGTGISEVEMTVSLDGKRIFREHMDVEHQHNVAKLSRSVAPSSHSVRVEVGKPYFVSKRVEIDVVEERWVFVRFWFDPQSVHPNQHTPTITIDVFDELPGLK
jgi:hypothetical protein